MVLWLGSSPSGFLPEGGLGLPQRTREARSSVGLGFDGGNPDETKRHQPTPVPNA